MPFRLLVKAIAVPVCLTSSSPKAQLESCFLFSNLSLPLCPPGPQVASRVVLTTWELVRRHGGSREHLLSARSGALRARAPSGLHDHYSLHLTDGETERQVG